MMYSRGRKCMREVSMLWTYFVKDLRSFLGLLHLHGAKGDPGSSLGVGVVVRLVFNLW